MPWRTAIALLARIEARMDSLLDRWDSARGRSTTAWSS
jgi:hypothetical protein